MSTSNGNDKPQRETCILSDGRRVKFTLKKRERDPYYLVYFRGPDRRPRERSTSEPNKRRATDSAIIIINEEYAPKPVKPNPSWDEAVNIMVRYAKADNLRPGSIAQYQFAVNVLRQTYPETHGPAAITPVLAQKFKVLRLEAKISPRTVEGNLGNLNIVYGHWWCDTCKILVENPFKDISPPKYDKPSPRIISADEEQAFLSWLGNKWKGWRLPLLFLEVKKVTGCRIGELAHTPTANLRDGRIYFEAVTTKGRKQRAVKLPPALYEELRAIAGRKFVFQAFSEQLRRVHRKKGHPHHAAVVQEFRPRRLMDWLQDQAIEYFKTHPEARKFKLHNFRGTAMSRAKMAGVSYEDAAIAFGCNPNTMREHYLSLEEVEISDRVMEKMQAKIWGEVREIGNPASEPTKKESQPVVATPCEVEASVSAGNRT
jgi:integrase